MALFENFPYTNLQQLNLDWIIDQLNQISSSSVLSVNGQTGVVILYQNADISFPNVPEDHWSMIRMADGTLRGIMFGNDDKAYIVHGNLMAELYANNNPPPYPVTRVNGMYGDIELYTEQYVRLPDLTDAQMQNWTFFRMLNNVSHGIQFNDDGTASIINGTSRYVLYTSRNQPPYPVDSVNGQTGTVVLFTDVNGAVGYPAITDPDIGAWSMERNVNGTVYGIRINDDGTVVLKVGNAEYNVYTSHDPQDGYVTDPDDIVQQVTEDSSANYWGIMRDTTEGAIGLMFENSDPDNPTAYIAYVDSNDQQQTLQILTPADIPATGVVSVNAKTGIVTLYGSDIQMNSNDSRKIDEAVDDVNGCIAYIEDTDISSGSYAIGTYLVWKGVLCIVTNAISGGDTISALNVSTISKGLANIYADALKFESFTPTVDALFQWSNQACKENDFEIALYGYIEKAGGGIITPAVNTTTLIATLPAEARPTTNKTFILPMSETGSRYTGFATMILQTNGELSIKYMSNTGYIWFGGVHIPKD